MQEILLNILENFTFNLTLNMCTYAHEINLYYFIF